MSCEGVTVGYEDVKDGLVLRDGKVGLGEVEMVVKVKMVILNVEVELLGVVVDEVVARMTGY